MYSLDSFRKPDTFRSMGIEIECGLRETAPLKYQYLGFFYVTSDSSVNVHDCNDYEFVSQPLPRDWLIKEVKRLEKKVGVWQTNHTCGIHIHVSRKWLSVEKAELIFKFYASLSWDQKETFFGRDSNRYCNSILANFSWDRYSAVNIQNAATIEFRMFRSGDSKWAEYCIRMVDYLIHNAKHLNYDAVEAFVDLNHPKFKRK